MKKVLAIIVTYNRKLLLQECIEALLAQSYSCDILIIDNNSTDGTKDFIDSKYKNNKRIIYHCMPENLGGAGGYNFGLREACKYEYDYFWLMDDDCITNSDSLEKLIKADNTLQNDWSFLSSKVLWKDGTICKTNVQRTRVAKKIKDFDSPLVKVDYASFVSLLIKKNDVIDLGLPIKDFFIWSDDLEYTRRFTIKNKVKNSYVAKSGYLVNESVVTHKCKENIGINIAKDSPDRIERYKYIYRNDVYTFKREGFLGIAFLFIRLIYHIFKIILSGKSIMYKLSIISKGHIDGIKFNPVIEPTK